MMEERINHVKLFERIAAEVERRNIPFVNCGGCGAAAAAIYDSLVKLGIECKLRVIGYNRTREETIAFADLKGMRGDLQHVIVETKEVYGDANGVITRVENGLVDYKTENWWIECTHPTVERGELTKMLRHMCWNPTFKVKNRRTLRHAITKAVNDYTKEISRGA